MSRSDQVTRHWLLLQRLEGTQGATLQELGACLPADMVRHPRTIRRDLEALEVCFPLLVERSGSTTRWRLIDGYRHLPRLAFSATELMALVFSRDLLKPLQGTSLKSSLDSALNKAETTLPRDALSYVRQMQGYFSVGLGPHRAYRQHQGTIDQLMRAIGQTRTIQMRYYSASRDRVTHRNVDPYRLWYSVGALYLVGYCHVRKDVRLFAVERIRSLTISNRPCQMPLGFDLEAYVRDALAVMRGPSIEVELLFNRATAAWVKDQTWHSSQKITALKDGRLRMVLEVSDTQELVGWILHFGAGVHVIKPESLKEKVRQEAEKIFSQA
ncbi:MAG: WYL domain-containing protein [Acidobacteria bacterium]|nr:WYL domain-containing protein [Acidobacteriota bacterium]